jgi:hypothetical protein
MHKNLALENAAFNFLDKICIIQTMVTLSWWWCDDGRFCEECAKTLMCNKKNHF